MRIIKTFLLIIFSLSLVIGQEFGRVEAPEDEPLVEELDEIALMLEEMKIHPVDRVIDPDAYIMGPGDEVGLAIQIDRSLTFPLTVTPTGDLFIPSVGVCHVSGLTLSNAIEKVQVFIAETAFPQAKSHMVLLNPRVFMLQVHGAVTEPGFIPVTSVTRLNEVVELAEGFRPLAKEYEVQITNKDGESKVVDYFNFVLGGDLESNPTFIEGDQVYIPFGNPAEGGISIRGAVDVPGFDIIKPNELLTEYIQRSVILTEDVEFTSVTITRGEGSFAVEPSKMNSTALKPGDILNFPMGKAISVTGFVNTPGGFEYIPGFTAWDYIALAGGNSVEGNSRSAEVIHRDGTKESASKAEIRQGDIIHVPRTMKNYLFGNIGMIPVVVSITSVILTYIAATK